MKELRLGTEFYMGNHAFEYANDMGINEEAVYRALARPLRAFGATRPNGDLLPTVIVMVGNETYGVVVNVDAKDENGNYTEVVSILDEFNALRNEKGISTTRSWALDLI